MQMRQQERVADVWSASEGAQARRRPRGIRSVALVPLTSETAVQDTDAYTWEGTWDASEVASLFGLAGERPQRDPFDDEAIEWIYEADRGAHTDANLAIEPVPYMESAEESVVQIGEARGGRRVFLWLLGLLVLGILGILACGYLLAMGNTNL